MALIFLIYIAKAHSGAQAQAQVRSIKNGALVRQARSAESRLCVAEADMVRSVLCQACDVPPFDGFWDLKHGRGTVTAATILLVSLCCLMSLRLSTRGFFNIRRVESINIMVEAISIGVPFFLWCVVNWALTTLMDGKGTMKDIYAAAYGLTLPAGGGASDDCQQLHHH